MIHPAFFPDEMVWRFSGFRTKSLRELQEKLGPEYSIKDYFPGGYHERMAWPVTEKQEFRAASVVGQKFKRPFSNHKRTPRQSDVLKVNYEKVLNLWQEGKRASEIVSLTGVKDRVVSRIVEIGRKKNDSRAVRRANPPSLEKIIELFESGMTRKEIAEKLQCKYNSVVGMVFRHVTGRKS